MTFALRRGAAAEDRALRHLQRQGLKLLARNWRCARGELDLVMDDAGTLVLVEVRSRARADYGGALESVQARKRQRLVRAAQAYLAAHPQYARRSARFDVVVFEGDAPPQWIKAAFDAED
ncbi:MAG: YraN family protein [Sinobacteraceae bacterium]|nr:YraN family protein [Nevskia sp.]MDI3260263.1 YraN family protein [Nevskiaceae bacterium]